MFQSSSCDVAIVGGGLAAAWTAYLVAARGMTVRIFERESAPLRKASGNRDALVMPYLGTAPDNLQQRFYSKAFEWSMERYRAFESAVESLENPSGILQFPSTTRLARLSRDGEAPPFAEVRSAIETSEAAGVGCSSNSFFVPHAHIVHPSTVASHLLQNPRIEVLTNANVTKIQTLGGGGWTFALHSGERVHSRRLVVCAAYESAHIEGLGELALEPVRGETLLVRAHQRSEKLRLPLSFDGYITPAIDGVHLVGAHYRHQDDNTNPDLSVHQPILERVSSWAPELRFSKDDIVRSRVCFRTSTLDRLPLVGSAHERATDLPLSDVYLNCGHGSRGFTSCPISGEIVTRLITGEPLAELTEISELVEPRATRAFRIR